jgi:membrane-bound lytic murein transglycosylase D
VANASLVSTPFVNKDIQILEEFDIKSSFLTDYELQKEFQKRLLISKKRYTEKLNNAQLFVPQIKKILRENNMPSAFLYLVMAESNFILNAHSSKSAKGLWQFMEGTANRYGLETDSYIDERMDILKSTHAAVKYLKKLHSMFGKWYLAAVAYNCGEGRVIEGLTRASLDMYCEDVGYKQCRQEERIQRYRYIIKMYQAKKVKFREINKIYKTVKKWKYRPDIDKLLVVQRDISRQYLPNESRNYIRKIISLALMNNSDFLLKDEHSHLLNRGITDPIAAIEVPRGILLRSVAKTVGISQQQLKELNQHIKKNVIPFEKEKYTLYVPYSKLSRYKANKGNLQTTVFQPYTVKSGDSLFSLARRFNTSYKFIKKHNKLKSNIIKINQELYLPFNGDIDTKPINYTVKIGDTLSKIANLHKIDVSKLKKDNNLKTSRIKIGDKLVIKYK